VTGRLEIALPIGAIAGTTGLATVMSTLRESGAKGDFARLLGFATASDNFFAILAFSLVLPLAAAMETGRATGAMYAEGLLQMAASVAIGFVLGLLVSKLVKRVRTSNELSMVVLAHVLLMVGVTYYFGFSVLLAGLTMGATAVNLTRDVRDRERAFAALHGVEFPVVAMFFLWAGTSLHIRALAGIGLLFGTYIVARALGKLAGPLMVAWGLRRQRSESRAFVGLGVSLLPQAGAAVGLAVLASDSLPVSGQPILAAVLGAVVVFELIGPVGVQWAARYVGEARETPDGHPLTLDEAIERLEDRKARVVVLSGESITPSMLDLPTNLVHKLQADLLPILVKDGSNGKGGVSAIAFIPRVDDVFLPESDTPTGPESSVPFLLTSNTADAFLETIKEYRPHVLFISLPEKVRSLLGPAEALTQRVGCPVLDIAPATQRKSIPGAIASLMPSVEQVAAGVATYHAKLGRTGIARWFVRIDGKRTTRADRKL
jgi:Kef-type K+ transport system membrane component KefB